MIFSFFAVQQSFNRFEVGYLKVRAGECFSTELSDVPNWGTLKNIATYVEPYPLQCEYLLIQSW